MQETSANFYKILADIRDTLTGGIRRHLQTRRSSATCDVPPNTKVFGYMRHLQTRRCSATCDVPNTKVFGYMRCASKHEGVRLHAAPPNTKVFGYMRCAKHEGVRLHAMCLQTRRSSATCGVVWCGVVRCSRHEGVWLQMPQHIDRSSSPFSRRTRRSPRISGWR